MKLDERRQWLDTELEKVLRKKQAMEGLEEELDKREAILQEREEMVKSKSELEIRKLRSSQVLSKVSVSHLIIWLNSFVGLYAK